MALHAKNCNKQMNGAKKSIPCLSSNTLVVGRVSSAFAK